VLPVVAEVGIGSLAGQCAGLVVENCPPRHSVVDLAKHGFVEEQIFDSDSSGTRVSVVIMPAMRACAESSGVTPIKVVELDTFNG